MAADANTCTTSAAPPKPVVLIAVLSRPTRLLLPLASELCGDMSEIEGKFGYPGAYGRRSVLERQHELRDVGKRDGMDRGTVGSTNRGRLRVEAWSQGRSAVVAPVGELDHHTADLLREPLESCLTEGFTRLVVDCSQLEFCDSTGLNVLLGARLKAEAAGAGSIWPGCCRWWPGFLRSPERRRSSPCTSHSRPRWPNPRSRRSPRADHRAELQHSCPGVIDA